MTTTPDPIDDVRAELARVEPPTEGDLVIQRGQLDDAIAQSSDASRAKRRRSRWLPASGIAVAGLATVVLVAVALQPGGDSDSTQTSTKHGLRIAGGAPGGAFAGLDLDSASAADVLEAAGESAALGAKELGSGAWTYTQLETTMPNVKMGNDGPKTTVHETHEWWTSANNKHKFAISEMRPDGAEAMPSLHYENLSNMTIGGVGWTGNDAKPGPRRAYWNAGNGSGNGAAGGDATIDMMVALQEQLSDVRDAADVAKVIDGVLDSQDFTFRNGAACNKGGCHSWGSYIGPQDDVSPEYSRTMYGRGLLLNALSYDVYPPATTRALYEYLANLDGTTVSDYQDGNVVLLFAAPGAPEGTGERVVLDGDTGRILERGRETHGGATRWTAIGTSDGPVVGGTLCETYVDECAELRDLADQLETDPKAKFNGVVDWMFIAQFCDGLIGRDGKPIEGNDQPPRSMSKDPKVKAERAACEKREAARAAAPAG